MKALKSSNWTGLFEVLAVLTILARAWMPNVAVAQEEKAVETFPTVLQRDITLWSDGTRLSGVLLYPKDRKEGETLPALVLCNGWGGTKAFLMRTAIAPHFNIKENSGRVHKVLKQSGVPTAYHVLKGKAHYDVYSGQCLDDVMKLEIPWFDKYLKDRDQGT